MPATNTDALIARTDRALAAAAMLVTRDTNLRIESFNSLAGVTLTIVARMIATGDEPSIAVYTHTPNTDRTIKTSDFVLPEGWLLSLMVYASAGAPRRGQCFVRASLIEGFTGATINTATLLQGYVQDTTARAWPGSPIEASCDGAGYVRTIVGTNPAAGLEISETVPTNARWELRTFIAQLVASAAAANRRPTLLFDDGANVFWRVNSNVNQVAGETSIYQAAIGAPFATLDARVYALPLPARLPLMGGYRVRSSTAAIDVGDDYAAPIYEVEEWIED